MTRWQLSFTAAIAISGVTAYGHHSISRANYTEIAGRRICLGNNSGSRSLRTDSDVAKCDGSDY